MTAIPSQASFKIGALRVVRMLEVQFPLGPSLLPIGTEPELLAARCAWAKPHFVAESGEVIFALTAHGLVSGGRRIVIDPCCSLDLRRDNPDIEQLASAMLDDKMAAAGFAPEDVDLVINTHIDGVGWNVRPGADGWRPTFPNAKSVWTSAELERVRDNVVNDEATARDATSLGPLRSAGKIESVALDHVVTPEVRFRGSPGHGTGNVDIWIESEGVCAVVVADNVLNPLQCAEPDFAGLDLHGDRSPALRRALLEECVQRDALLIGTHFGTPGAGRVRRSGDAWMLEAQAPT